MRPVHTADRDGAQRAAIRLAGVITGVMPRRRLVDDGLRKWPPAGGRRGVPGEVLGPAEDNGDVVGVPGWSIVVRNRLRQENAPGEVLVMAERAAAESGQPHAAAIVPRRGRPTEDSYVLLSMRDFAKIVAQLSDVLPARQR